MSSTTTGEKTTQEQARDQILKAYMDEQIAKSAAVKKKQNPSIKQQFVKELRGIVESF